MGNVAGRLTLPSVLLVLVAGTACSLPAPVALQPVPPDPAEAAAVRAVVDRLFDGMRERDTAKMASAFHAEARLHGAGPDGTVRVTPAAEFVASIAAAPEGLVLDEVIDDVEIRIDGPLATAWMYYDFFAGDNFSHCGHNAMQFLRTGGEWRIVALTDSRQRDGCRAQRRPGGGQSATEFQP
jgi:hypothetical protein